MLRRTVVVFWVAISAAVVLLGGSVATFRRLFATGVVADAIVLVVSLAGLGVALVVAGRIAWVVGRAPAAQGRVLGTRHTRAFTLHPPS